MQSILKINMGKQASRVCMQNGISIWIIIGGCVLRDVLPCRRDFWQIEKQKSKKSFMQSTVDKAF